MARKPAATAAPAAPATAGNVTVNAISKAQAVRECLAAGVTNPEQGCAWIKDKFGLQLTTQHFSATKARPADGSALQGKLLEAMETMKPLVKAHGVEKIQRIAELVSGR
jgi:predicted 3-demethylubiquinone-9 3-methyltransferase (glyoxalase superfamily)